LSAAPALAATGAGPNGINIGIDFNWNNGPAGLDASFISTVNGSGATLNNNAGAAGPTASAGNFIITYSIGGVLQTVQASDHVYSTWPASPGSGNVCDTNPGNSAPLTLWNCCNTNSFGQIFYARATGVLSGVTMSMTCLNPAGGTLSPLYAVIYQVNSNGLSIPATPLAQVQVDLSSCPTLTSWASHTFAAADFASIPINFSGVTVNAGTSYGIYFAGPLVPGAQLPGVTPTSTSVPTLSEWGLIFLAATLAAIGAWRLRRRVVA
jgi:hypothetical protein